MSLHTHNLDDPDTHSARRSKEDSAEHSVPNPKGRNQHLNCPSKDDIAFQELLREYHKISTSRRLVSQLLKREHGIEVSERTITRRWNALGLKSARHEDTLDRNMVIRLVAEQLALDPSGLAGQSTVKKQIALRTGVHLKRDTVASLQRYLDPAAVAARHPTSGKPRNAEEPGQREFG